MGCDCRLASSVRKERTMLTSGGVVDGFVVILSI